MAKNKYKPVKFPVEAFANYNRKIQEMQKTVNQNSNKPVKIHFTDGIRFFSQRPVYIENQELIDYFIKKKKRLL